MHVSQSLITMPISSTNSAPDEQESSTDRISTLPNTLLSHILSFLPTKDSLATTVLSSRWKSLWKNTSNLTFCYTHYPYDDLYIYGKDTNTGRFMEFLHFVNRTLLLHDSKCIDKFSLDVLERNVVYDYNARELIMSWVDAAVARKVKVVALLGRRKPYSDRIDLLRFDLPSCLYTCKSLQVLHLCGVVVLHPFGVVSLPNLHTLRLEEVRIPGDESLTKLVSGCSMLKTLYVLRGCDDGVVTFTVCSPTLEHLTITTFGRDYDEHEEKCINLELDVPALKYLHLHDKMLNDVSMEDMPSLVEAKLGNNWQFFNNQFSCNWNGIDDILRSLCLVKALTLDVYILMALRHSGLSPRFRRLTNLTLQTACCKWSSLQDLLEGSDSLEYLTLNLDYNEHRHETCWTKPNELPACLSCLKEISIKGFSGRDDELALLGYILGNSTLLKIMKITASSHLNLREKHQLLQQVSKVRRLSKMCEVIFQ